MPAANANSRSFSKKGFGIIGFVPVAIGFRVAELAYDLATGFLRSRAKMPRTKHLRYCTPFLCALASFLGLCGDTLHAQDTTGSRFGDLSTLTADPTGLVRERGLRVGPRYPRSLVAGRKTGSPVLVYVIDTTGLVEVETATFLNEPPVDSEFAAAVCDFLPNIRFKPFVVADMKWRVLLVDMYSFDVSFNLPQPDTAKIHAASRFQHQKQEEFATEPIVKAIASLERLPHCARPLPVSKSESR